MNIIYKFFLIKILIIPFIYIIIVKKTIKINYIYIFLRAFLLLYFFQNKKIIF